MNTIFFELDSLLIDWNHEYFFLKEFRGDCVDNVKATVSMDLKEINFLSHIKLQKNYQN